MFFRALFDEDIEALKRLSTLTITNYLSVPTSFSIICRYLILALAITVLSLICNNSRTVCPILTKSGEKYIIGSPFPEYLSSMNWCYAVSQ